VALPIAGRFLSKLGGFFGGRLFFIYRIFFKLEAYIGSTSSRTQCPAVSASLMMAELAWASWETIVRRTVMMAQSTCSAAEYHRMLDEKTAAAVEISGCRVYRMITPRGSPFPPATSEPCS